VLVVVAVAVEAAAATAGVSFMRTRLTAAHRTSPPCLLLFVMVWKPGRGCSKAVSCCWCCLAETRTALLLHGTEAATSEHLWEEGAARGAPTLLVL
jgi:hypothetical protein